MAKWTQTRKKEAARLYLSGLTVAKVATALKSNTDRVADVLDEQGIPRRKHAAYRESYRRAAQKRGKHGPRVWTPERDQEVKRLYLDGMFQREVAEHFGTSQSKVYASLKRTGTKLPRTGRRGATWKGGRIVDKSGYVLVKKSDHPDANSTGYVREHRLVMEKTLGRRLESHEVVHHKNGERSDNRPENLQLYSTNGAHLSHELRGRCPNWSPEGRARILAAVRRPRKRKSRHHSK